MGAGRVKLGVGLEMGGSRYRLVRLLLIECLLIALSGGALALFVADFAVGIFSTLEIPADVPIHAVFQLDQRVLGFTAIVSIASALLFGLVPAIQATKAYRRRTACRCWFLSQLEC